MQVLRVPQWKLEKVDEISKLALDYPVIALGNLNKIRASQIHSIRKSLRGEVVFLVAKNNLVKKAFNRAQEKKPKIKGLADRLEGSNLILFTKMNPFKLLVLLEQNKTKLTAKVGDIAPDDIVISEGNTGMPPGPVISDFTEVGIRTKIEAGSVWVVKDTVVVKKGDPISLKLASMLSRLGIKPIESSIPLYAAYDNGLVIPTESLRIDVEGVRQDLLEAENNALNLSVFLWYPTSQNIQRLLKKTVLQARSVAVHSSFLDKDFISDLLRRARSQTSLLEGHLHS